MLESIFDFLGSALYENYWLAVTASFGWGIASVLLSPCHLSSVPLIIGYVSAQERGAKGGAFGISLVFSVGILVTIAVIGVVTAALGRLLGDIGAIANSLVAIVFFAVGLYLLDLIPLPFGGRGISRTTRTGLAAAFLLGLLFGIGLGPCTFAYMAPVLGLAFQVASTDLSGAALLMAAFGIGHCAVITGAGTLTGKVRQYLHWTEESTVVRRVRHICGVLVLVGGFYLLWVNIFA